jgi:hypothetical protein
MTPHEPSHADIIGEIRDLSVRFEEHVDQEAKKLVSIAATLKSVSDALTGDHSEPGLFERTRNLEKLADSARSLRRWFMAGIGGLFLTLVWNAFTWYMENRGQ